MEETVPDDFELMWGDLRPLGRSASSGGYFRQPFTSPERELVAWFLEQAEARGLRVEADGFGNIVAWWDSGSGPAVLTGSHLDSVLDGGAYDGPLGVVSALAAIDLMRSRGVVPSRPVGVSVFVEEEGYRFDFTGSANHAGTTRMEDRQDPMLTYAMTALAANKQARLAGQRATFGRVEVAPNGTNAIPSRVTAWLDARCSTEAGLASLVDAITSQATDRAGRDGTSLAVTAESVSGSVAFDASMAARLAADHEGGDWPVIPTQAGHDAGILSAAGVPTAMLFVRNPTGVSHSPEEHASIADCLVGVSALADTLERLTR